MSTFAKTGRNIICIGRNYVAHVHELNNKVPKEPFYFLKPTSSYIEAGQGPIEVPQGINCHHEVELGVVIGKGGRDIPESQALDHVAGYTLSIDVTGRNWQEELKKKGLPWAPAKGFDTWAAVGPFIEKSKLPSIDQIGLWLKINGETKQDGMCSDMIFKVPKLIEHVSSIMTLSEGDLIMTGTPSGVGPMQPSDKIQVGLTYGADKKEVCKLDWSVEARKGGYVYQAK
ncbi:hypothetical protein NliqN6_0457 [Naganishia liquefaciens]|uniref:Fumarylacetoacetase-like C-terminal domain-containing protein n=1 Tax=Naganishia liquefaciens TaxID=104408 RepID=A0A8H3YC93_9TREE|nr:hypothetical protein NliqN6_0457 [Naganishia liquefaciens]